MEIGLTAARLRPRRRSDAESLVRHANRRNLRRHQPDVFPSPHTAADAQAWLRHAIEESPEASCAVAVDGSAAVFKWNVASVRVLGKAGNQLEGRLRKAVIKDGQIIDRLLYACVRDGGRA